MINYKWKVSLLKKKNIGEFSDVVVSAVWQKTGVDPDGYGGTYKILTEFNIEEIEINSFINYEDLTEENIIEWIKINTNQDDVNKYILSEIEKSRSQEIFVNENELPWNKLEEVIEEQ
jgi:hypothetical protein